MLTIPLPLPLSINAVALCPGVVIVNWRTWRYGSEFWRLSVLAHEWVHHYQQSRDGWFTFMVRWLFRPAWRDTYEREAEARQRQILNLLRS